MSVRYSLETVDPDRTEQSCRTLLEEVARSFDRVHGAGYRNWASGHWSGLMAAHRTILLLCGRRTIGFCTTRSRGPHKGDIAILYIQCRHATGSLYAALLQEARDVLAAQGHPCVTSSVQSWDRALGRDPAEISGLLDRLGFGSFTVEVRETLPRCDAVAPRPPDQRFRVDDWSDDALAECARVMAQSPDLLMDAIPYTPSECEELIRFSSRKTRPMFLPQLSSLVTSDDRVEGFCTCTPGGTLCHLFLRPEARGRGLGMAMLSKALRGLARLGVRKSVVTVIEGNREATSLYEKYGYRIRSTYPFRFWLRPASRAEAQPPARAYEPGAEQASQRLDPVPSPPVALHPPRMLSPLPATSTTSTSGLR